MTTKYVIACDQCDREHPVNPTTGLMAEGDMLVVDVEDLGTQELWSVHLCSFTCVSLWAQRVGGSWDKVRDAAARMAESEGAVRRG